jgi:uncharacterized protein YlxP (DUF503 family)
MLEPPTTIVGLMHVALRLPLCRSLKEKRSAIKPCIHYLRRQMNLAVSETGNQDLRRSAVLALVTVSGDKDLVEQTLAHAERYLCSRPDLEVVEAQIEIL